jgi:ribosomal protein L12E/L44/L45/RPP1/RPP2
MKKTLTQVVFALSFAVVLAVSGLAQSAGSSNAYYWQDKKPSEKPKEKEKDKEPKKEESKKDDKKKP